MKEVTFTVACTATYKSTLEVPDEVAKSGRAGVLEYIRDHLNDAPVEELEWLSDLEPWEAVREEDIRNIEGCDEEKGDV